MLHQKHSIIFLPYSCIINTVIDKQQLSDETETVVRILCLKQQVVPSTSEEVHVGPDMMDL